MDVRELIGKAVVSLDEATRLGRSSDVLFDPARLRVAAVRVTDDAGGYVLPFDRIASIGPDAITVERAAEIRTEPGLAGLGSMPGIEDMSRLKVVDEGGTFHGTIRTLHADPKSGDVTSLDLEKGGVLGLGMERDSLPVDAIRSVGDDVVTVRSNPRKDRAVDSVD